MNPHRKPLKRLMSIFGHNTGLKAGVNENEVPHRSKPDLTSFTPRGLGAIAGRIERLRASFLSRVCL